MKQFSENKNLRYLGVLGAIFMGMALVGGHALSPTRQQAEQRALQSIHPVVQKLPANSPVRPEAPRVSVKQPAPGDKIYYTLSTPDDPSYNSQWYLQSINAPAAWDITTGSSDVTVAVLDSGFALNHQDLLGAWKPNTGESGGGRESDGVDNDGNGYIDDYRGWDFVNGDNTPEAGTTNPNGAAVDHGTEVAGLIGAQGNNGLGAATVTWNVSLLPLQVMSDAGTGYSSDVAAAIYYAVARGVDVISMSLGTSGNDPTVQAAVDYAVSHNIVVVAAAGNCGNSTQGPCAGQAAGYITFPASYNRVISVGATTSSNTRASFSSYGERLDVMAPGSGSLISPTWTSGNQTSAYASSLNGTSFSAPIVASTAALLRSLRPDTSVDDIRALIMASAAKPGMSGFYSQTLGHGLIDVGRAVTIASELNASGEATPEAQAAGGSGAEHLYASSDTLSNGCSVLAGTWCTTWLRNDTTNYERFLPYARAGDNGQVGWNFSATSLSKGPWQVYARQGDSTSAAAYSLMSK